jgi:iron-sulfur cluster assembly protein
MQDEWQRTGKAMQQETRENTDIRLTDAAIRRMREQTVAKGVTGIRLAVRAAGCSGLEYVLDFCDGPEPGDHILAFDGFSLFVDAESYNLALSGLCIDFQQDVLSSGFVFQNPNKKGECGCGVSFSV